MGMRLRMSVSFQGSPLLGLPLRADSHVTIATKSAGGRRWELWRHFRVGAEAPVASRLRGHWEDRRLGILRHSDELKAMDLMGYPVGAAFVVS